MPRYKGVLTLEDEGPDTPTVHLFDYSADEDHPKTKSGYYSRQLIALESCIYLGRRTLADIKNKSQAKSKVETKQPERNTENGTLDATSDSTKEEHQANGEVKEAKEEGADGKEAQTEEGKEVKKDVKAYLKEGQEFQAYILKCPNGPYDYAMKLWDRGRAAPPDAGYPKEGQEEEAVVVDRNGDLLTVACGSNIAFARRKSFLCSGVDPDDLSLPFARLKVSLRRLQEREPEVLAAGWEATLTQIVVPYDL